jgi:hypothetical protein
MEWGDAGWIDLAQDRDQWRSLVNTVMKLRFRKILGNSLVPERLAAPKEGFNSMEIVS